MPIPLQDNGLTLLRSIVTRLEEPPFSLSFPGGVHDLAAEPPTALLQLLYHILSYLEPCMALDVKNVPEDERVARTVDFLCMLKCPFSMPATDEEGEALLAQGLREGEKAILFPVLAWCLDNLSHLHRRAYLGRYLMPVDVPFNHSQTQDPTLADLLARFRGLQEEFISVHKAFEEEQAALGTTNSRELRAQIKQLEEEKHQLEEKVGRMARVGLREVGFSEMLSLTRAVREEEKDEGVLSEKVIKERQALELAERRMRALRLEVEEEEGRKKRRGGRKGGRTRTPIDLQDGATVERLVEELQEEVRQLRFQVTEQLPLEIKKALLSIGREGGVEGRNQHQQLGRFGREDMEKLVYDVKRAELHVQYWKAKIDEIILTNASAVNPSRNNTGTGKAEEGAREGGKEGGRDDRFLRLRERALVAAMARREKEKELEVLLLKQQQQPQQQLERLSVERRVFEQTKEILQIQITGMEGCHVYQKARAAGARAAVAAAAGRGVERVGVTTETTIDTAGCGADGGGDAGRGTQDDLEKALRKITKEIKMEKRRLQPLVKILKEERKEAGALEEEHRLRKAQYERVMTMPTREGGREDREGGREMLALKTLLEVKLKVDEEEQRGNSRNNSMSMRKERNGVYWIGCGEGNQKQRS